MKSFILSIFLILSVNICFSQESAIEEDQSINGQFDKIYRISTSYQTYKVISKDKFQELKENILDSIKQANSKIVQKEGLLKTEKENSRNLQAELTKTKEELKAALEKENSISLFGLSLSKITYNLILWIIIILLASGLGVFIFKFSRSNVLTKKAKENLEDVEHEFETHRKKSLEREQKLRRQLQDEINKQRNS